MATNVTAANNAVEYFGIAHGHIMTQPIEQSNEQSPSNDIESRPENGIRDAAGKFIAGNPGGPGRLPSITVTDAIRADLKAGKAEVVKDKLFDLMEGARRESVQLAAAQEIIDRAEGKAMQSIRHAGVFMVMAPGADTLQALDSWADADK
jgi:hypothetical protein